MLAIWSLRKRIVEGKKVHDILLDTGCFRTIVHKDLVLSGKIKEGDAIAIRCARGDTVLYSVAEVTLEVDGRVIEVEADVEYFACVRAT